MVVVFLGLWWYSGGWKGLIEMGHAVIESGDGT